MKNSIIFFTLAILFSCVQKTDSGQDAVTLEVFKQLAPDADFSQKRLALIIPFDGCLSCFDAALTLIPEVSGKQGLVIMPNLHKRIVINTLEDLGIGREAVIIDTLQLSIKSGLVDGNPKLFLIENNKIVFSETVEYPTLKKIEKIVAVN